MGRPEFSVPPHTTVRRHQAAQPGKESIFSSVLFGNCIFYLIRDFFLCRACQKAVWPCPFILIRKRLSQGVVRIESRI
jgi:hypothetical protein